MFHAFEDLIKYPTWISTLFEDDFMRTFYPKSYSNKTFTIFYIYYLTINLMFGDQLLNKNTIHSVDKIRMYSIMVKHWLEFVRIVNRWVDQQTGKEWIRMDTFIIWIYLMKDLQVCFKLYSNRMNHTNFKT